MAILFAGDCMNIKTRIHKKALALHVGIPLATGALSSLLTHRHMEAFHQLRQPPLSPPDWVFPVVWTGLYVLMGTAAYLVHLSSAGKPRRFRALSLYAATLVLNFFWPLLFFGLGAHLSALMLLVMLLALIAGNAWFFYSIRPIAGLLLLPYLLWTAFAGYLNLGVYLLNR